MTIVAAEAAGTSSGAAAAGGATRSQLLNSPRSGARPLGGSPGASSPSSAPPAAARRQQGALPSSRSTPARSSTSSRSTPARSSTTPARRTSSPSSRPAPARSSTSSRSMPTRKRQQQQPAPPSKRRQRFNSATRRLTGASTRPGSSLTDYQAIIGAEFVVAELLVAATPFASRQSKQGLSPYEPADMVKLLALGLVYLLLELIATGSRGAGRVSAWFGALILLAVGLGEASHIADIIKALSGGTPHPITLTGTQAPATKDPTTIPPLGQGNPPPAKTTGTLGGA